MCVCVCVFVCVCVCVCARNKRLVFRYSIILSHFTVIQNKLLSHVYSFQGIKKSLIFLHSDSLGRNFRNFIFLEILLDFIIRRQTTGFSFC